MKKVGKNLKMMKVLLMKSKQPFYSSIERVVYMKTVIIFSLLILSLLLVACQEPLVENVVPESSEELELGEGLDDLDELDQLIEDLDELENLDEVDVE